MGKEKRVDVMVDIETLGNKTESTIIQIASKAFYIVNGKVLEEKSFNRMADIEQNKEVNVTGTTLKWWLKTNKELFEELLNGGDVSSEEVVLEFWQWLKDLQEEYGERNVYLWGNGILFDNKILQYHMEAIGKDYPIHYQNDRDVRTIVELTAYKTGLTEREVKQVFNDDSLVEHDAYDDVMYQINLVRGCYRVVVENAPLEVEE